MVELPGWRRLPEKRTDELGESEATILGTNNKRQNAKIRAGRVAE
jgi:hypothetical protein